MRSELAAIETVEGLEVDEATATDILKRHAPFAALERVLNALVRAGADRQAMHARLREHSLAALEAIGAGSPNPLADRLASDTSLLRYLQPARIRGLLEAESYLGLAPARAHEMASLIRDRFQPEGPA